MGNCCMSRKETVSVSERLPTIEKTPTHKNSKIIQVLFPQDSSKESYISLDVTQNFDKNVTMDESISIGSPKKKNKALTVFFLKNHAKILAIVPQKSNKG